MLEHFDINIVARSKPVEQICNKYQINSKGFIIIANLYNGFNIVDSKFTDEKYSCITFKLTH
jgi:hypothetical protein